VSSNQNRSAAHPNARPIDSATMPRCGVNLTARLVNIREYRIAEPIELCIAIPVKLPVTQHHIMRIVLHYDASLPFKHSG
jgi:hypothetical protein